MEQLNNLPDRFNDICFTVSREQILAMNQSANTGSINNVISRISQHCFGVLSFDDAPNKVEMFYINHDNELKGDIICLDLDDADYFEFLLRFCNLLAKDYNGLDAINTFNIFQTDVRSFLEKKGFFTTTSFELKKYRAKDAVFVSTSPKGIKNIEMIDRVELYRDFFNNNYEITTITGKEYVYLMVNNDTALIKIGTSKKPRYREKTLHSQEPAIHLIAVWCCSKEVEKELHKKYSNKRIRGEWFRLLLEDLTDIDEFMKIQLNNHV